MPTEKEIAKDIENGQFTRVLQHVKVSSKPARDRVDSSFRVLKELHRYCHRNYKGTRKPPLSEVDSVCELTLFLCQTISSTWKCNRLTFMQCLYHINRYLVKESPLQARRVSEYFFQLKNSSWDADWEPNESIIVSNIIHDFIFQLTDSYLEILSSAGENSLSSWLDFIFRLFELHGLKQLYKLFIMMDSIWVKVYHKCNDELKECVVRCWTELGKWLKSLTLSKITVEIMDRDISSFFNLIERMVSILSVNDVSLLFEILETLTADFKLLIPRYEEDMNILTGCIKFFANIDNPSVSVHNFDAVFSSIMNRKCMKSAALPCVVAFIIKFRSQILAPSTLIESQVTNMSKLLLELMLWSQKESDKPSRKSKMITDLSYVALSILAAPPVSKGCLTSVFPQVRAIVKLFLKAMPDADDKVNICIGVSAILSLVLAFKKIEQFEEPLWLCRYVLQIFLKIDPEVLWEDSYYKSYVATWLRNVVIAYSKCNLGVEVQVMLIVFAAYQPKYTLLVMKEWATLKNSKCQSINMDATVLDVISVNGEEIEKQFPQLKLSNINLDLLLLGEIYGYSKLRELCGDPVLVVYKTAARTVKDHVVLANILCCTVEAFSVDTSDTAYVSKFEASLINMIKHLQMIQENDRKCGYDSSVVLCTIGNLFYQKARLEIQQARQKSEAEVAHNEKWVSKKNIPVFRAGEKDDLDLTEVNLVGSTYKLIKDSEVLSSLTNAVNYWDLCEKTLVPNIILGPTLSFMKGSGYLMRMHCYRNLETTCWNLLYRMAAKLGSLKHQILAAAELLFSCQSVDSTVTSEIGEIFRNPKRIDRKCYVYHLYRTSYARNLFFRGKVDDCRRALEEIDVQAVLPFFLVNAQFTILKTLFDIERPKDEAPLLPIIRLFENILYLIKHNEWETFNEACVVQCLMYDLSWLLGTIYSDLKCVRRARLYTKTELNMVERLALPVRVCEFMTLKCWVDLLTWNVTDSDLNAREVENMLELGVLKTDSTSELDPIKCVPHFLSKKECSCNLCTNINYPALVLTAIINRIIILAANGDRCLAQNVINVGLSIVKILEKKNESSNHLWTAFSSSVARFYYIIARTNALWEKYKDVIYYASLACEMLESEPVKNHGLIVSSKQLLLATDFAQNYVEPKRTVPVSRIFADQQQGERAVTPEAQKYSNEKPWESTTGKTAPKGYFTSRKSLYNRSLKFGDPHTAENDLKGFDPLEALTPGSNLHVKTTNGMAQSGKKTAAPSIIISNLPDELPILNDAKGLEDDESKCDNNYKIQLGIAALDLNGNGATPVAKRTGKKVVLGSTRKPQTEKKSRIPRTNLFSAGSMCSLTKTSTTPAVKVFYDPEGVEHSTTTKKKAKTREGVKKTTRLGVLSKIGKDDKFGTPSATKAVLTAKSKLTFDEGLDDELELVLGRRKRGNLNEMKKTQNDINAASVISEKSGEPSKGDDAVTTVVKDESNNSSVIAPFKEVASRGVGVRPKRLMHGDTTLIESPEEKDVNTKLDGDDDLVCGKLGVRSEEQNSAASYRDPLESHNGSQHASIKTRQVKPLKKRAGQVVTKPQTACLEQPNDESDDENIAAPFRKLLDSDGRERICRRQLIHDETTIMDQSVSKLGSQIPSKRFNLDDSMEQVVTPFRKVLNDRGVRKIGSSKPVIHDDTTVMDESLFKLQEDSPDLIESSIVQTTPPKNGRRYVALTPLTIEDQMSKLTLTAGRTNERPAATAETPRALEDSNRTIKTRKRIYFVGQKKAV